MATALLAVSALVTWCLVSGAAILESRLPGGLPLGNALAAAGLCAGAGAAVALGPRGSVAWHLSRAALVVAVAWLPVSVALAGNLALNFGGGRGTAWMAFTLGALVLVGGSLPWAAVAALHARRGRTRPLARHPAGGPLPASAARPARPAAAPPGAP